MATSGGKQATTVPSTKNNQNKQQETQQQQQVGEMSAVADLKAKIELVSNRCEQVLTINEELVKQLQQQPTSVASKFSLKSKFGSSDKNQQQQQHDKESSQIVKELKEQLKRIRETASQLSLEGKQLHETTLQCMSLPFFFLLTPFCL